MKKLLLQKLSKFKFQNLVLGIKWALLTLLLMLTLLTIAPIPPALAADTANGAKIFSVQCAGCHINGGNIVRRNKTLKQKALNKYGVASQQAIAYLVKNGKNNMPAYQERLSEQQIEDVSAYVLEQADKGWR